MKKPTLELIEDLVAQSKTFPNPTIEYNFELPKGIKADNFFGVKAVFNEKVSKDSGVITYKLQ